MKVPFFKQGLININYASAIHEAIDAVISENKLIISSLSGAKPLKISPPKSNFLLYSREEKLSFDIIALMAFACFKEFLLFSTERKENSPFFAKRRPGILKSLSVCSN